MLFSSDELRPFGGTFSWLFDVVSIALEILDVMLLLSRQGVCCAGSSREGPVLFDPPERDPEPDLLSIDEGEDFGVLAANMAARSFTDGILMQITGLKNDR